MATLTWILPMCRTWLIAQLPPVQREAFLLREEGGLSVEEIAEVTGVNAETAKSRLRYAVAKLRKGLRGQGVSRV
jgi:RNA polymerase sigma-70 factor (ECF subfamily)